MRSSGLPYLLLAQWAMLFIALPVRAVEDAPSATAVHTSEAPPLDRLTTKDERALYGYIIRETPMEIVFQQIIRPRGRPTYGVEQTIVKENIASLDRLSSQERLAARRWFRHLREFARIEAGRIEDVELERVSEGGAPKWRYSGKWFVLESDADESLVRRVAVRVEQLFSALDAVLAARVAPESARPITIRLCGAQQEYDGLQRSLGLAIDNPAFYDRKRGLLAAGADLNRLAGELQAAEAEWKQARGELARLKATLPERIAAERQKLSAARVPPAQTERTLQELRAKLRSEIAALSRQADAVERKNSAVFDEATRRLFRTLRHEALHAWLDRWVFPGDTHEVPRWLNEGLAQVLESAVLEGGTLRIDAPHAEALAILKGDLRTQPLPLADVLEADEKMFLVLHGRHDDVARRHYAYAWGLAHYLTFERRLLSGTTLEDYVARREGDERSALARFETLVGEPLDEFQSHWRAYMLKLK